jgi:hypothetical protein
MTAGVVITAEAPLREWAVAARMTAGLRSDCEILRDRLRRRTHATARSLGINHSANATAMLISHSTVPRFITGECKSAQGRLASLNPSPHLPLASAPLACRTSYDAGASQPRSAPWPSASRASSSAREGIGAKRAYLSAVASTLDFRGQPFDEDGTAGAFLRRALGDPELTAVTAAVAWARFRGLGRLTDALEAFRERGGFLRIIVGIDEGGATRPGLMAALTFFDEAYVFHDPSSRTFHPKIYLADGPRKAILLVGSSNATPGGLFANYEASLEATFELPRDEDAS